MRGRGIGKVKELFFMFLIVCIVVAVLNAVDWNPNRLYHNAADLAAKVKAHVGDLVSRTHLPTNGTPPVSPTGAPGAPAPTDTTVPAPAKS